MSFYENRILPCLINCTCGLGPIEKQREKVVPKARGKVLEIGMGSGLNLPHYDKSQVDLIWGLEPNDGMRRKAKGNIEKCSLEVVWLDLPSEQIPLDDNVADTVVVTYTLCTIPDAALALSEMRRVLKPQGQLLFSEHGASPDQNVRKWQDRLNPIWSRLAGGCNLNRQIDEIISNAGFTFQECEQDYIPGPKFTSFQYWGSAIAAS